MVKIEIYGYVRARESIGVIVTDLPTDSEKSVTLNLYEKLPDGNRIPYDAEILDKTIKCAKKLKAIDFSVTVPTYTKNKVIVEAVVDKNGIPLKAEEYLPLKD